MNSSREMAEVIESEEYNEINMMEFNGSYLDSRDIDLLTLLSRDLDSSSPTNEIVGYKERNALLHGLVDRVKLLEHVTVPTAPRRLRNGDIVHQSGSWVHGPLSGQGPGDRQADELCKGFGHIHIAVADPVIHSGGNAVFDVGGHCIVSQQVLEQCARTGWGRPHPFAGTSMRY
jgi:hypothetical protein